LKNHLPNSILVAIDIEGSGSERGVCEVGLAILPVNGQAPRFHNNLTNFCHQNQIRVETFEAQQRGEKRRNGTYKMYQKKNQRKYGVTTFIDSDEEIGPKLEEILSQYVSDGKEIILLAFGMATELAWIAQACPSLASYFTAWLDVQNLANQRCNLSRPISLMDAFDALRLSGHVRAQNGHHWAANDALAYLGILSKLISTDQFFTLPQRGPKKEQCDFHEHFRQRVRDRPYKDPFTACVETIDGSLLPFGYRTTPKLNRMFRPYKLKAFGISNSRKRAKESGSNYWWFSFYTLETLEKFTERVDGMTLPNINLKLRVVETIVWQSCFCIPRIVVTPPEGEKRERSKNTCEIRDFSWDHFDAGLFHTM
jgi:hypothetical protein